MEASDLTKRDQLAKMCNEMGLKGEAAEIGVHRGHFASRFLNVWQGERYHAVDPWQNGLPDYEDEKIKPNRDRLPDYDEFVKVTDNHSGRIVTHFELSSVAGKKFAPATFDFVYIDADHRFHKVLQDIQLWYQLVKPGGVLAGHDVINGSLVDVQDAIELELIKRRGYSRVYIIPGDAWSWYIIKKED
jgi:SAM-dependent methyltransferase